METKTKGRGINKFLIIGIVILVAVVVALVVILLNRQQDEVEITDGAIPFASGTVVLSEDQPIELTPPDAITLNYKNDATSSDGLTFDCYIANSPKNTYDMYIGIYSDIDLTDELFLSGVFEPGTGFREITLEKSLNTGNHKVYLVMTQVEGEEQSIHNQVVVTMNFIVS